MYCTKCGTKNLSKADFCKECGFDLSGRKGRKATKTNPTAASKNYATFKMRLGAFLIDIVAYFIFAIVLGEIGLYLFGSDWTDFVSIFSDTLLGYLIMISYYALLYSLFSTSVGKYVYGLTVLDEDGEHISIGQSISRSVLMLLSMLFFGIGYWNMNKNKKRQAWHDIKTRTVVKITDKKDSYLIPVIISILSLLGYIWIMDYLSY